MGDLVHFSALELRTAEHPRCPLCCENIAEFEFNFTSECRPIEELRGRCCFVCAAALLDAMRALADVEQEESPRKKRTICCNSKYIN